MKYKFLVVNGLDDGVEIEEIEAENIDEAWEVVDVICYNYDEYISLSDGRLNNLKKALEQKNIPLTKAYEVLKK